MPLQAIERLLKAKMGLHSSTVGSNTVEHAVQQRMRVCGIEDINSYHKVISHSDTEMNALIDSVVVPETWFYRDRNAFVAFREWVSKEWAPRGRIEPLRILSLPCSTGEEPYTLAMCLADCGIPADLARIHGVDISSTNLQRARAAQYGSNSFRDTDLAYRDKYFEAVDQGFQLKAEIQTRVQFEQANILDPGFVENCGPYHVIFCRNLLIYFDRSTQHRTIDRLEALLTQDGLLFLGHSETSLLLERRFTALESPRCFGFRRGQPGDPDTEASGQRPARRPKAKQRSIPVRGVAAKPFSESEEDAPQLPNDREDSKLLRQAFRLADQGHLDEAAGLCEMMLANKEHQADAHYLLGLVREAAGNIQEAEQFFRKVVYLAPRHYAALTHLSAICQQKGDEQNAKRFRDRASRAQRHETTEVATE